MIRTRKNRGFTLIEVLVALAILAIGVLAVVSVFPAALGNIRVAHQRTMAAELAEDTLGRVRMTGAAPLFDGAYPLPVHWGTVTDLYGVHRLNVQPLAGAGDTSLQRVVFMLDMNDGRRQTFVTYVSEI